ncbi:sulfite exporter TauE/SafE family protein [Fodinicurvata halophila]|uniref:Probable membrane transporter protein n=1 Tax=Fodinicurvata halophila TaxID=1419723 RepID=A0ABV8UN79_9PROT
MDPLTADTFALYAVGFSGLLLAGFVKGVIGMGLPLVALPVLAYMMPVPEAITVLSLPVVLSNLVQAFQGGHFLGVLKRFWPVMLSLVLGVLLGVQLLVSLDPQLLYLLLGIAITGMALLTLSSPRFTLKPSQERPVGLGVCFGAGVLGGVSNLPGPPLALYLVALRLEKTFFISAISIFFLINSAPLYAALALHDVLGWYELLLSAFAVIPVFGGVFLGQWVRKFVSQARFQTVVLLVLVVIGLSFIWRAYAG